MRLYAVLFAVGLAVYGTVMWDRVGKQSGAPHFVLQANAWIHGSLAIEPPLRGDDWAKVETVQLDDGSLAEGRRLKTRPMFKLLDGTEIPIARVKVGVSSVAYVSFPAFPALLMIPSAIIGGANGNDSIVVLVIAALILPLTMLLLRRLVEAGLSKRTVGEDLWIVAALAFGSVLFFTAVQAGVWFAAHVIGVALALVYAWASVEARRPLIAGLALGAAAMTRTPMAFMFPLFLFEAWRIAGSRKAMMKPLIRFAIPVVAFAIAGMVYNYVRFKSLTEFGHNYLDVRQQIQIEQFGLASYHYLARNLAVAFTLLPELSSKAPFVQISGHGLAVWITTPILLFLLWPREKPPIHRALWITIACVAVPSLMYQNSGWFQFGYRFSLDWMVFATMLLAIGDRPLGRLAKALIVIGIAVNLFGAVTFQRKWQFYRGGPAAYDVVVAH